ncbi:DUF6879 family protein [Thermomonospora catenispora]|uniref:DUF6879 family protein n=1 Tax=Thermomonospora catenispora TaxID=2493090 RepID=UPI0030C860A6
MRWPPRRRACDLCLPGTDFWLFDGELVLWNHVDGEGRPRQKEITTDPAVIKLCASAFEAAWERGIDHEDYRARLNLAVSASSPSPSAQRRDGLSPTGFGSCAWTQGGHHPVRCDRHSPCGNGAAGHSGPRRLSGFGLRRCMARMCLEAPFPLRP